MVIGIISDTHDKLYDNVLEVFRGVDLILHAGDIGRMEILVQLNKIAPTKAVYGNTDIYSIASVLPSKLKLEIDNLNFLILHNIGSIKNFSWRILRGDYNPKPDAVVFGHTHSPIFRKDADIFFINPGSASAPRRGYPASVMKIWLIKGQIENHELIKLIQD